MEGVARCPQCAFELDSEDSVICLKCGYNLQTRTRTQTVVVFESSFWDWAKWLAPGIFFALVTLVAIGTICYFWLALQGWDENGKPTWIFAIVQVWGSVICAGIGWRTGKFAYHRLVVNPHPPEQLKR
jgi:hypothetical protein